MGLTRKRSDSFLTDGITDARPYVTLVAEVGVQLPVSPAAITEPVLETPRKPTVYKTLTIPATPSNLHVPEQPTERIREMCISLHFRLRLFQYGVQCDQSLRQVCLQIPTDIRRDNHMIKPAVNNISVSWCF
jgi:hypothetical protein